MNKISMQTFSSFDTGNKPSQSEPERFYHGFVLGLMVELRDRYEIRSNRESGFGRYDVVMEPRDCAADDACILEFKVHNEKKEADLEATVRAALQQIDDKQYAADLIALDITPGVFCKTFLQRIAKQKCRLLQKDFAGCCTCIL